LKIIATLVTTIGEHIFCKIDNLYLKNKNVARNKVACILTEGAQGRTVVKDSLVGKINRKVVSTARSFRCIMRQEVVAGKVRRMDHILKRVWSR
jgi:hypothetical protein